MSLPAELGAIQEIFQGNSGKTILYVQDAHTIYEAQKSIQGIIDYFQKNYGLNVIAVEGGEGKFDSFLFRTYPDSDELKQIFDQYLQKGELSGAVAASVLNSQEAAFYGIEDKALLEEGILTFLRAQKLKPQLLGEIEQTQKELDRKKEKIYPPPLLELDRSVKAFQNKEIDLASLVQKLSVIARPPKATEAISDSGLLRSARNDMSQFPHLEALVREVENREAVNPEKLASEIDSLINTLRPLLPEKKDLMAFNEKFQDYRTLQVSPKLFAHFLLEEARQLNLNTENFSLLRAASRNYPVLLQMQAPVFFKELEAYLEKIKQSLFPNEEAKALDQEDHKLALLKRLTRFELTREEWEEIHKQRGIEAEKQREEGLKPFWKFYEVAEEREKVFLEKLKGLSQKEKTGTVLFLSGGFHAAGVTEALKKEGISYVLISPRLTQAPEETPYLRVMQGDVSWKNYFRVENGKVNLFDAFSRAAVDGLLKNVPSTAYSVQRSTPYAERSTSLKSWRDEIIRRLANEERIAGAHDYTRFIDEAALRSISGEEIQSLQAQWRNRIERFLAGLKNLVTQNKLTEENLFQLFKNPASMPVVNVASMIPGSVVGAEVVGRGEGISEPASSAVQGGRRYPSERELLLRRSKGSEAYQTSSSFLLGDSLGQMTQASINNSRREIPKATFPPTGILGDIQKASTEPAVIKPVKTLKSALKTASLRYGSSIVANTLPPPPRPVNKLIHNIYDKESNTIKQRIAFSGQRTETLLNAERRALPASLPRAEIREDVKREESLVKRKSFASPFTSNASRSRRAEVRTDQVSPIFEWWTSKDFPRDFKDMIALWEKWRASGGSVEGLVNEETDNDGVALDFTDSYVVIEKKMRGNQRTHPAVKFTYSKPSPHTKNDHTTVTVIFEFIKQGLVISLKGTVKRAGREQVRKRRIVIEKTNRPPIDLIRFQKGTFEFYLGVPSERIASDLSVIDFRDWLERYGLRIEERIRFQSALSRAEVRTEKEERKELKEGEREWMNELVGEAKAIREKYGKKIPQSQAERKELENELAQLGERIDGLLLANFFSPRALDKETNRFVQIADLFYLIKDGSPGTKQLVKEFYGKGETPPRNPKRILERLLREFFSLNFRALLKKFPKGFEEGEEVSKSREDRVQARALEILAPFRHSIAKERPAVRMMIRAVKEKRWEEAKPYLAALLREAGQKSKPTPAESDFIAALEVVDTFIEEMQESFTPEMEFETPVPSERPPALSEIKKFGLSDFEKRILQNFSEWENRGQPPIDAKEFHRTYIQEGMARKTKEKLDEMVGRGLLQKSIRGRRNIYSLSDLGQQLAQPRAEVRASGTGGKPTGNLLKDEKAKEQAIQYYKRQLLESLREKVRFRESASRFSFDQQDGQIIRAAGYLLVGGIGLLIPLLIPGIWGYVLAIAGILGAAVGAFEDYFSYKKRMNIYLSEKDKERLDEILLAARPWIVQVGHKLKWMLASGTQAGPIRLKEFKKKHRDWIHYMEENATPEERGYVDSYRKIAAKIYNAVSRDNDRSLRRRGEVSGEVVQLYVTMLQGVLPGLASEKEPRRSEVRPTTPSGTPQFSPAWAGAEVRARREEYGDFLGRGRELAALNGNGKNLSRGVPYPFERHDTNSNQKLAPDFRRESKWDRSLRVLSPARKVQDQPDQPTLEDRPENKGRQTESSGSQKPSENKRSEHHGAGIRSNFLEGLQLSLGQILHGGETISQNSYSVNTKFTINHKPSSLLSRAEVRAKTPQEERREYRASVSRVIDLLWEMEYGSSDEKVKARQELIQWQEKPSRLSGRVNAPAEIIIGHFDMEEFNRFLKEAVIDLFLNLRPGNLVWTVKLLILDTAPRKSKQTLELLIEILQRARAQKPEAFLFISDELDRLRKMNKGPRIGRERFDRKKMRRFDRALKEISRAEVRKGEEELWTKQQARDLEKKLPGYRFRISSLGEENVQLLVSVAVPQESESPAVTTEFQLDRYDDDLNLLLQDLRRLIPERSFLTRVRDSLFTAASAELQFIVSWTLVLQAPVMNGIFLGGFSFVTALGFILGFRHGWQYVWNWHYFLSSKYMSPASRRKTQQAIQDFVTKIQNKNLPRAEMRAKKESEYQHYQDWITDPLNEMTEEDWQRIGRLERRDLALLGIHLNAKQAQVAKFPKFLKILEERSARLGSIITQKRAAPPVLTEKIFRSLLEERGLKNEEVSVGPRNFSIFTTDRRKHSSIAALRDDLNKLGYDRTYKIELVDNRHIENNSYGLIIELRRSEVRAEGGEEKAMERLKRHNSPEEIEAVKQEIIQGLTRMKEAMKGFRDPFVYFLNQGIEDLGDEDFVAALKSLRYLYNRWGIPTAPVQIPKRYERYDFLSHFEKVYRLSIGSPLRNAELQQARRNAYDTFEKAFLDFLASMGSAKIPEINARLREWNRELEDLLGRVPEHQDPEPPLRFDHLERIETKALNLLFPQGFYAEILDRYGLYDLREQRIFLIQALHLLEKSLSRSSREISSVVVQHLPDVLEEPEPKPALPKEKLQFWTPKRIVIAAVLAGALTLGAILFIATKFFKKEAAPPQHPPAIKAPARSESRAREIESSFASFAALSESLKGVRSEARIEKSGEVNESGVFLGSDRLGTSQRTLRTTGLKQPRPKPFYRSSFFASPSLGQTSHVARSIPQRIIPTTSLPFKEDFQMNSLMRPVPSARLEAREMVFASKSRFLVGNDPFILGSQLANQFKELFNKNKEKFDGIKIWGARSEVRGGITNGLGAAAVGLIASGIFFMSGQQLWTLMPIAAGLIALEMYLKGRSLQQKEKSEKPAVSLPSDGREKLLRIESVYRELLEMIEDRFPDLVQEIPGYGQFYPTRFIVIPEVVDFIRKKAAEKIGGFSVLDFGGGNAHTAFRFAVAGENVHVTSVEKNPFLAALAETIQRGTSKESAEKLTAAYQRMKGGAISNEVKEKIHRDLIPQLAKIHGVLQREGVLDHVTPIEGDAFRVNLKDYPMVYFNIPTLKFPEVDEIVEQFMKKIEQELAPGAFVAIFRYEHPALERLISHLEERGFKRITEDFFSGDFPVVIFQRPTEELFGHRIVAGRGEEKLSLEEILEREFGVSPAERSSKKIQILDLGARRGEFQEEFSRNLRQLGYGNVSAVGVEIKDELVKAGRDRGLNIVTADATELHQTHSEISLHSFDLVTLNAPVFISGSYVPWLEVAKRYVKENGLILIRLSYATLVELAEEESAQLERAIKNDRGLIFQEFSDTTTPELPLGNVDLGPLILVKNASSPFKKHYARSEARAAAPAEFPRQFPAESAILAYKNVFIHKPELGKYKPYSPWEKKPEDRDVKKDPKHKELVEKVLVAIDIIRKQGFRNRDYQMVDRAKQLETYTTIIGLEMPTHLLLYNPRTKRGQVFHLDPARNTIYLSLRYLDFLKAETGKSGGVQELAVYLNRAQQLLDTYNHAVAQPSKPRFVYQQMKRVEKSFESDDRKILGPLFDPKGLSKTLDSLKASDEKIRQEEILPEIERLQREILEREESLSVRRVTPGEVKPSPTDYSDLSDLYGQLAYLQVQVGRFEEAGRSLEAQVDVLHDVQRWDLGALPITEQIDIVLLLLLTGFYEDFLSELEGLLTGKAFPKKLREGEKGYETEEQQTRFNVIYPLRDTLMNQYFYILQSRAELAPAAEEKKIWAVIGDVKKLFEDFTLQGRVPPETKPVESEEESFGLIQKLLREADAALQKFARETGREKEISPIRLRISLIENVIAARGFKEALGQFSRLEKSIQAFEFDLPEEVKTALQETRDLLTSRSEVRAEELSAEEAEKRALAYAEKFEKGLPAYLPLFEFDETVRPQEANRVYQRDQELGVPFYLISEFDRTGVVTIRYDFVFYLNPEKLSLVIYELTRESGRISLGSVELILPSVPPEKQRAFDTMYEVLSHGLPVKQLPPARSEARLPAGQAGAEPQAVRGLVQELVHLNPQSSEKLAGILEVAEYGKITDLEKGWLDPQHDLKKVAQLLDLAQSSEEKGQEVLRELTRELHPAPLHYSTLRILRFTIDRIIQSSPTLDYRETIEAVAKQLKLSLVHTDSEALFSTLKSMSQISSANADFAVESLVKEMEGYGTNIMAEALKRLIQDETISLGREKMVSALMKQVEKATSPEVFASLADVLKTFIASSRKNKRIFEQEIERFIFVESLSEGERPKARIRFDEDAKNLLSQKMPTLMEIQKSWGRMDRFRIVLSLLRDMYPHEALDRSQQTPIEYAEKTKSFIALRELRLMPVSESFRRHIVYIKEGEEIFAIELKIPGKLPGRKVVYRRSYEMAKQMRENFGEDVNVAPPLFFYAVGSMENPVLASLYGSQHPFKEEPLGMAAFIYHEGKRLMYDYLPATTGLPLEIYRYPSKRYLDRVARENHMTLTELADRILIETVVTGFQLHLLGVQGKEDFHLGNVRLRRGGHIEFVGDFEDFEKNHSQRGRRIEMQSLLGDLEPLLRKASLKAPMKTHLERLLPEIVEKVVAGASDRDTAFRIAERVSYELGLSRRELQTSRAEVHPTAPSGTPLSSLARARAEVRADLKDELFHRKIKEPTQLGAAAREAILSLIPTPVFTQLEIKPEELVWMRHEDWGEPTLPPYQRVLTVWTNNHGELDISLGEAHHPTKYGKIRLKDEGEGVLFIAGGRLGDFPEAKTEYPNFQYPSFAKFAFWVDHSLIPFAGRFGFKSFRMEQLPSPEADLRTFGFEPDSAHPPFWILKDISQRPSRAEVRSGRSNEESKYLQEMGEWMIQATQADEKSAQLVENLLEQIRGPHFGSVFQVNFQLFNQYRKQRYSNVLTRATMRRYSFPLLLFDSLISYLNLLVHPTQIFHFTGGQPVLFLNPLFASSPEILRRTIRHELAHILGFDESAESFAILGYLEDHKIPFTEEAIVKAYPSPLLKLSLEMTNRFGFPQAFEKYEDLSAKQFWLKGFRAQESPFVYQWYEEHLPARVRGLLHSRERWISPVLRILSWIREHLLGYPSVEEDYGRQVAKLGMVLGFVLKLPNLSEAERYQTAKLFLTRSKTLGLTAASGEIHQKILSSRSEARQGRELKKDLESLYPSRSEVRTESKEQKEWDGLFQEAGVNRVAANFKRTERGVHLAVHVSSVNPVIDTSEIPANRPFFIVDLGHGQGELALRIAQRYPNAHIVGIEFDSELFRESEKLRAKALEKEWMGQSQVQFYQGDYNDKRFYEELRQADVIYYASFGTRDPDALARTLLANTKPGARFIVLGSGNDVKEALKQSGVFDSKRIARPPMTVYTRRVESPLILPEKILKPESIGEVLEAKIREALTSGGLREARRLYVHHRWEFTNDQRDRLKYEIHWGRQSESSRSEVRAEKKPETEQKFLEFIVSEMKAGKSEKELMQWLPEIRPKRMSLEKSELLFERAKKRVALEERIHEILRLERLDAALEDLKQQSVPEIRDALSVLESLLIQPEASSSPAVRTTLVSAIKTLKKQLRPSRAEVRMEKGKFLASEKRSVQAGLTNHGIQEPARVFGVTGVDRHETTQTADRAFPLLVGSNLAFQDKALLPKKTDEIALGKVKPTQEGGSRNAGELPVPGRPGHSSQANGESGDILQGAPLGRSPAEREAAQVAEKGPEHFEDRGFRNSSAGTLPSFVVPQKSKPPAPPNRAPGNDQYSGLLPGGRNTVTTSGKFASSFSAVPNVSSPPLPVNFPRAEVRSEFAPMIDSIRHLQSFLKENYRKQHEKTGIEMRADAIDEFFLRYDPEDLFSDRWRGDLGSGYPGNVIDDIVKRLESQNAILESLSQESTNPPSLRLQYYLLEVIKSLEGLFQDIQKRPNTLYQELSPATAEEKILPPLQTILTALEEANGRIFPRAEVRSTEKDEKEKLIDEETLKQEIKQAWKEHIEDGYVYTGTDATLLPSIKQHGFTSGEQAMPYDENDFQFYKAIASKVKGWTNYELTNPGGFFVTPSVAIASNYARPGPERLLFFVKNMEKLIQFYHSGMINRDRVTSEDMEKLRSMLEKYTARRAARKPIVIQIPIPLIFPLLPEDVQREMGYSKHEEELLKLGRESLKLLDRFFEAYLQQIFDPYRAIQGPLPFSPKMKIIEVKKFFRGEVEKSIGKDLELKILSILEEGRIREARRLYVNSRNELTNELRERLKRAIHEARKSKGRSEVRAVPQNQTARPSVTTQTGGGEGISARASYAGLRVGQSREAGGRLPRRSQADKQLSVAGQEIRSSLESSFLGVKNQPNNSIAEIREQTKILEPSPDLNTKSEAKPAGMRNAEAMKNVLPSSLRRVFPDDIDISETKNIRFINTSFYPSQESVRELSEQAAEAVVREEEPSRELVKGVVQKIGSDGYAAFEGELRNATVEVIHRLTLEKVLGIPNAFAGETISQIPLAWQEAFVAHRISEATKTIEDRNFVIYTGSVLPVAIVNFVKDVFPLLGKESRLAVIYDKEDEVKKMRSELRETGFWPRIQYQRVARNFSDSLANAYQNFGKEGAVVVAPSAGVFSPLIAPHRRLVIEKDLLEAGAPRLAEDVLAQIGVPLAGISVTSNAEEIKREIQQLFITWAQQGFQGIEFRNAIIPNLKLYLQYLAAQAQAESQLQASA